MGCSSCGSGSNGTPKGCGDKGHCSSGGCNKHNTYDWISARDIYDPSAYNIVEVSFKNGSNKDFFINDPMTYASSGDMVVVEAANGYDVGQISLSGDLVRLQMKKKYIAEENIINKILRIANERDLQKLEEARMLEYETMVRSRAIARTLGLDMKIGDVAYQGDKKKATFYYTSEGRVDFRELVKEYAREFKVKIEMRQIGARQEAARIGGIGSCGRELCCSTWLSDFKSVSTSAARYQNIAINQSKLTGQCGRLKCCLNYELDTYLDALQDFPEDADILKTKVGRLVLIKTDIFKGLLYYAYENNDKMRGNIIAVSTTRAKDLKAQNDKGIIPNDLASEESLAPVNVNIDDEDIDHGYEDVTGLIELRPEPKKKKRKNKGPGGNTVNRRSNQKPQHTNQRRNEEIKHAPQKKDSIDSKSSSETPSTTNQQKENTSDPAKKINPAKNETDKPAQGNTEGNPSNKKKRYYNKNRKPRDGNKQ